MLVTLHVVWSCVHPDAVWYRLRGILVGNDMVTLCHHQL